MSERQETGRAGWRVVWAAGLVVAAGAGVATAHGLYEVAAAARVPAGIAWLYPLITDGLALVGYAATSRVGQGGRRYAATIVVLAAGLSGLAQATYLTGSLTTAGSVRAAPALLRFGVGAWPAIAAALTAHLLHLISTDRTRLSDTAGQRSASNPPYNAPAGPGVQPRTTGKPAIPPVQPRTSVDGPSLPVQPAPASASNPAADASPASASLPPPESSSPGGGSAAERARAAARSHHARHGTLPTVTELTRAAQVARGTAGTVLKALRAERRALHVVNANLHDRTDS
jgi:hypothetical protein